MQELLDVNEVSRILRLKVSTIHKYTMSGKLPIVKLNGNLRFREDQIDALIKDHSVNQIEAGTR